MKAKPNENQKTKWNDAEKGLENYVNLINHL